MMSDCDTTPACPRCRSLDLRPTGWQRPNIAGRTRVAIPENEDAPKQRVQCRACRSYFTLLVGQQIPAHPGRPKVSRSACDCGSVDLRRAGWGPDGRQMVRCNVCQKGFALPAGMLVPIRPADRLGRRIVDECMEREILALLRQGTIRKAIEVKLGVSAYSVRKVAERCTGRTGKMRPIFQRAYRKPTEEHVWQLPDATEEATALFQLVEQQNCDPREIRALIGYSDSERRCLELLAGLGLLASAHVAGVLSFRDRVLEQFDNLIDAELAALSETNQPARDGAEESNSEVVEVQASSID